jgi:hypothetical protein
MALGLLSQVSACLSYVLSLYRGAAGRCRLTERTFVRVVGWGVPLLMDEGPDGPAGRIEQSGFLEIGLGPTDPVVEDGLVAAGQHFLTVLVADAELPGHGFDHVPISVPFAIREQLEQGEQEVLVGGEDGGGVWGAVI